MDTIERVAARLHNHQRQHLLFEVGLFQEAEAGLIGHEAAEAYAEVNIGTELVEAVTSGIATETRKTYDPERGTLVAHGIWSMAESAEKALLIAKMERVSDILTRRKQAELVNIERLDIAAGKGELASTSMLELSPYGEELSFSEAESDGQDPERRIAKVRLHEQRGTEVVTHDMALENSDMGVWNEILVLSGRSAARDSAEVIANMIRVPKGTRLEDIAYLFDNALTRKTGQYHLAGRVVPTEPITDDYSILEKRRKVWEQCSQPFIQHVMWMARELAHSGLPGDEILEMMAEVKYATKVALLVLAEPERARAKLDPLSYQLATTLIEEIESGRSTIGESMGIFGGIGNMNGVTFYYCGGKDGPELEAQEWYGAYKTIGRCVNCHEGPKEVGEKSWCRDCITGHCGKK